MPPRKRPKADATVVEPAAVDETPVKTDNGPRDIDPVQSISQDPGLDYSQHSDPEFGPLGADDAA